MGCNTETRIYLKARLFFGSNIFSLNIIRPAHMNQGSELFNNLEVKNLFTKSRYTIHPSGANASKQNGPVERGHRTIPDIMHSLLAGAGVV